MKISVNNISKAYGDKQVLKDFSCVFEPGSINQIVGESGVGKTTLLRLIMGLEKCDTGSITFENDGKVKTPRFSAVFQEDRLCEDFTALANVMLVSKGGAQEESRARDLIERVGLGEAINEKVSELSGGMKRRVAIARALMAECDTLILDEPFTGLDLENRALAAKLVINMANGRTVICVSHDETDADLLGATVLKIE